MEQKTILVVEDEASLQNILLDKLKEENFLCFKANNGEEGLKIALEKHPDLILLDIIMPVMEGMTMLKKLREDTWGKKVPVILLTNLSDEAKINTAEEKKAADYLVKADWKLEDVVTKVKETLNLI